MIENYIFKKEKIINNLNNDNLDDALELIKLIETENIKIKDSNIGAKIINYKSKVLTFKKNNIQTTINSKINTIDILNQSRNQLFETEEVGINIINNLDKQYDTIKNCQKNTNNVNNNMLTSNHLLNKMKSIFR